MFKHIPSPIKYREDINGLRAWAVISVLLFHFSFFGLPGGFVGVDVFFVISGYLMTTIIVTGHEKGKFSIIKFYASRLRRIAPALIFLIFNLLIIGWFFLPSIELKELSQQGLSALSFVSNILFWKSSGYFDSSSEEKWFLHTWSLAVEAQFYVLFPLFITLIYRLFKTQKAVFYAVIILFFISISLNIFASTWKPQAAFYLLPTRAWELLAGSIVLFISKQKIISESKNSLICVIGWSFILFSTVYIDKNFLWPGYWTIITVLGAGLVIFSECEKNFLTSNKIAQWIGDRSYSLYLWHWPFAVGLVYFNLESNFNWVLFAGISSFLMAHLSFHFIEIPTRTYLASKAMTQETSIITLILILMSIGLSAINFINVETRLDSRIEIAATEKNNMDPRRDECFMTRDETISDYSKKQCIYGQGKLNTFLFGDSHSSSVATALGEAARESGYSMVLWGLDSCPTVLNSSLKVLSRDRLCKDFNQKGLDILDSFNKKMNVVIVNRTAVFTQGANEVRSNPNIFERLFASKSEEVNGYLDKKQKEEFLRDIVETACQIQKKHQVYLVRPIPEMGVNIPQRLSRDMILGKFYADFVIPRSDYLYRTNDVWLAQQTAAMNCGVKVLDTAAYLCDDNECMGSIKGRPLYYDDDHLSEYGNKLLIPMFKNIYVDLED